MAIDFAIGVTVTFGKINLSLTWLDIERIISWFWLKIWLHQRQFLLTARPSFVRWSCSQLHPFGPPAADKTALAVSLSADHQDRQLRSAKDAAGVLGLSVQGLKGLVRRVDNYNKVEMRGEGQSQNEADLGVMAGGGDGRVHLLSPFFPESQELPARQQGEKSTMNN